LRDAAVLLTHTYTMLPSSESSENSHVSSIDGVTATDVDVSWTGRML